MKNLKKNIEIIIRELLVVFYGLIFFLYSLVILWGDGGNDIRYDIFNNDGINYYRELLMTILFGVIFIISGFLLKGLKRVFIFNGLIILIYIQLLFYFEIPYLGNETWFFYRNFWLGMLLSHILVFGLGIYQYIFTKK